MSTITIFGVENVYKDEVELMAPLYFFLSHAKQRCMEEAQDFIDEISPANVSISRDEDQVTTQVVDLDNGDVCTEYRVVELTLLTGDGADNAMRQSAADLNVPTDATSQ
jgi:hypothetical protein